MTPVEYAAAGFKLVPIARGTKGPNKRGWNLETNCHVADNWTGNIGLAHAYSGTCALDLDRLDDATTYLKEHGIDVAGLLADPTAVQIVSGRPNRAKLLYRLAQPLPSKKLAAGALELRCASGDGATVQDVLPPSVHPDTGKPYTWAGDWRHIPPIPQALLALWEGLANAQHGTAAKADFSCELDEIRAVLQKHSSNAPYDAEEGDSFIKIGMALHDATDGSDEGYALWDEFLSTGDKYQEGLPNLPAHWRSFKKGKGVTARWLWKGVEVEASEFSALAAVEDIELEQDRPAPELPTSQADRDMVISGLRRNKNTGRIQSNIGSIYPAVQWPELIGMHVGYDDFRAEIMTVPLGRKDLDDMEPFEDEHYTDIRLALERFGFEATSVENVRQAVAKLAKMNRFDSARDWLSALAHDGAERCGSFLHAYLGADDSEYTRACSMYLWTALAGRVMEPGCQADMAVILVGRQGCRKSTSVAALVPRPEQFVELSLDEEDADLARQMKGCLVGELSELRGLTTRDLESIKGFITRKHEKWVPKYREFANTYPRRTILIGTTNQRQFLGDDTGERRFLPVEVKAGRPDAIRSDLKQLWAEARDLFTFFGGIAWEHAEKLARIVAQDYKITDSWEEVIGAWLAVGDGLDGSGTRHGDVPLTVTEVASGALNIDAGRLNRSVEMRIGSVLRGFGYERKRLRVNGSLRWAYSR